jgi:hypothetical protein
MNTVFIVQNVRMRNHHTGEFEDKYDFQKASVYGNVTVVLTKDKTSPLVPAPALFQLQHALKNFSDDDYLLPVGNPAFVAAAGAIAAKNNGGRFKVLIWDKRTASYIESHIQIR